MIGVVLGVSVSLLLYFGNELIAHFYTNIPVLRDKVALTLEFVALFYILNCEQACIVGVARGIGIYNFSNILLFLTIYVFASPL